MVGSRRKTACLAARLAGAGEPGRAAQPRDHPSRSPACSCAAAPDCAPPPGCAAPAGCEFRAGGRALRLRSERQACSNGGAAAPRCRHQGMPWALTLTFFFALSDSSTSSAATDRGHAQPAPAPWLPLQRETPAACLHALPTSSLPPPHPTPPLLHPSPADSVLPPTPAALTPTPRRRRVSGWYASLGSCALSAPTRKNCSQV